MASSNTAIITLLLLTAAALTINAEFRVLRGGDQFPTLKVSNSLDLVNISALTGETVQFDVLPVTPQTVISQEGVKIQMVCSLFTDAVGKPFGSILWEVEKLVADDNGVFAPRGTKYEILRNQNDRVHVVGEFDNMLEIQSTVIRQDAEDPDYGLYTCTACTSDAGCQSATVKLFLIGAQCELDTAEDNAPKVSLSSDSEGAESYPIGTDVCIETGFTSRFQIRCDVDNSNVAFPTPSRTWYKDNALIYSVDKVGMNPYNVLDADFMEGNSLLIPGVILPEPILFREDGSLHFNFEASGVQMPNLAGGATNQTASADVFNALLGTYRCEIENDLGMEVAETVIASQSSSQCA